MVERALNLPPPPPRRPERVIQLDDMGVVGDAARPLSFFERIIQITMVRRLIVVVVLGIAWQLGSTYIANSLLFPTLGETFDALWDAVINGPLLERTFTSLQVLLMGYAIGLTLAGLITTFAVST